MPLNGRVKKIRYVYECSHMIVFDMLRRHADPKSDTLCYDTTEK